MPLLRRQENIQQEKQEDIQQPDIQQENLTTADIATERKGGPKLVGEERRKMARRKEGPDRAPLFQEKELQEFRMRWDKVQTAFVDEPRAAVQQADSLVASAIKRLAEQFADERSQLERQWDRGDNVSTEDLRQALRRYRAFFDRLLSM
jgi:hypothetical protein